MWLRYGRRITCPDYKDLAKRLKFAIVQKLCVTYGVEHYADKQFYPDVQELASLLPVKSTWRNATVEIDGHCFPTEAVFEFAFTHLFLCKAIILRRADLPSRCWRSCMRLPAIAACARLDVSWVKSEGLQPTDVVQWLEHEAPPEETWSQPRQLMLHEVALIDSIDDLLTALKTAFMTSSSPKPYVVRIHQYRNLNGYRNEVLLNEKTHEQLIIETLYLHSERSQKVVVERA